MQLLVFFHVAAEADIFSVLLSDAVLSLRQSITAIPLDQTRLNTSQ